MFCQSLAADEFQSVLQNANNEDTTTRNKRGDCTFDIAEGKKNEKGLTCRGGGCRVLLLPVPVEFGIKGEMCTPDLSDLIDLLKESFSFEDIPKYITNIEEEIQKRVEKAGGIVDKVIESSGSVAIELCLAGAGIAEKIGVRPCWQMLKIEFAILAKRLTISTELSLPVLEARAKIVLLLPGFDLSGVCKYKQFFCKDYCQDYDYYGSAEVKAKLFIFGATLYEKKWADPVESCSSEEYRVIFDYSTQANSFGILPTVHNTTGYRGVQFDGSYLFNHDKKIAFSFTKQVKDEFLVITHKDKALAKFPIFGKQLEKLIKKKQELISYFRLINSTVFYTSKQTDKTGIKILEIDWSKAK